jgi:hypothetical protein
VLESNRHRLQERFARAVTWQPVLYRYRVRQLLFVVRDAIGDEEERPAMV